METSNCRAKTTVAKRWFVRNRLAASINKSWSLVNSIRPSMAAPVQQFVIRQQRGSILLRGQDINRSSSQPQRDGQRHMHVHIDRKAHSGLAMRCKRCCKEDRPVAERSAFKSFA
jgi:hypothetical protein